ncbi:MAG: hypothetical protein ACLTZT_20390 [Butyricimonas faecalis]
MYRGVPNEGDAERVGANGDVADAERSFRITDGGVAGIILEQYAANLCNSFVPASLWCLAGEIA